MRDLLAIHCSSGALLVAILLTVGCGFQAAPTEYVASHFKIKVGQRSGVDATRAVWASSTKDSVDGDLSQLAATRTEIDILWIRDGSLTAASLGALSEMPQLKDIYIHDIQLGQREIDSIGQCKSLELVALDHCSLDECDVMPLANLPNLREVYLIGSRPTRESVDDLLRAKPSLHLTFLPLPTAEEAAEVRRLRRLGATIVVSWGDPVGAGEGSRRRKAVDVRVAARFNEDWNGTTGDFEGVAKLSRLGAITLEGEVWDDHAADVVSRLPNLTSITLKDTKVTDAALTRLSAIQSVNEIEVWDFWGTPERITTLEGMSPKIKVRRGYSAPPQLRALKQRRS